jgi:hypothetical protein
MMLKLDWTAIKNLLDGWKDGTEGKLDIKKKGKPKSTVQLGYYYGKILPDTVKAFMANKDFSLTVNCGDKQIEMELTIQNMDYFFKLRYAAATGKYVDKSEMNMAECAFFEDWCIAWVATWLKYQIPPSNPNWRQDE